MVWDSLKAFLRGLLIQHITRVKKKSRAQGEHIRNEVMDMELERQYVLDPSPGKQELWTRKQQEYKAVITRNAENRRLFQRQRCFEEGERVG